MSKKLMKSMKDTMKVGIGSMVGHQAIGAIGGVPGMPAQAQTTANIAHTGLTLTNVGQLAMTARDVVGETAPKKAKKDLLPWV